MKRNKTRALVPAWARWLAMATLLVIGVLGHLPTSQRSGVDPPTQRPAPATTEYRALTPEPMALPSSRFRMATAMRSDGILRVQGPPMVITVTLPRRR